MGPNRTKRVQATTATGLLEESPYADYAIDDFFRRCSDRQLRKVWVARMAETALCGNLHAGEAIRAMIVVSERLCGATFEEIIVADQPPGVGRATAVAPSGAPLTGGYRGGGAPVNPGDVKPPQPSEGIQPKAPAANASGFSKSTEPPPPPKKRDRRTDPLAAEINALQPGEHLKIDLNVHKKTTVMSYVKHARTEGQMGNSLLCYESGNKVLIVKRD